MALAADKVRASRDRGVVARERYRNTNAQQVYAGAIVGVDNATGLLVKWGDTATFMFEGVALENHLGTTATDDTNEVAVDTSGLVLEKIPVTGVDNINDVGDLVFATDDDTFTLTPNVNSKAIGVVEKYYGDGTKADVRLFTPAEYRGLL